jgi:hypothetical protein
MHADTNTASKSNGRVVPGHSCRPTRDCHAEEDAATGAIRNHRANAGRGHYLDCGGPAEAGAIPLPEPHVGVAPSFDSAVLPNRRRLGGIDWTRSGGLRHPFNAARQADADLPAHQESAGSPASTRAQQT